MDTSLTLSPDGLINDLRGLIKTTRTQVARTVNAELVMLHWQVGQRLRTAVVGPDRAAYGEQLVAKAAQMLSAEFGRGFSKRNLHYMMRFAEVYPDLEIVNALQLSWTHLRELIAIEDPLKRTRVGALVDLRLS